MFQMIGKLAQSVSPMRVREKGRKENNYYQSIRVWGPQGQVPMCNVMIVM